MRILDRYIGRAVLGGILLALMAVVSLLSILILLEELDNIGQGRYGVLQALHYTLLHMPTTVYDLFPLAALLGGMLGLGALANNNELVVMRAAGISLARIIWSVLRVGIALTIAAIIIGEYLAPRAIQEAKSMRAAAKTNQISLRSRYGFWAQDGRTYINIRNVLPGARLANIFIYEFDQQHRLRVASYAESAYYLGEKWVLIKLAQTYLDQDKVTTSRLPQAAWSSLLDPELLSVVVVKPKYLPVRDLYKYIAFLRENGLDTHSYELIFWRKIAAPLVILVMLYLSIPFVFGPLRTVGVGQRILSGILAGIAFYLFDTAFGQMGLVYGFNPVFGAFCPLVLMLTAAVWAVARLR